MHPPIWVIGARLLFAEHLLLYPGFPSRGFVCNRWQSLEVVLYSYPSAQLVEMYSVHVQSVGAFDQLPAEQVPASGAAAPHWIHFR
jgi:hypothetical protein